MLGKSLNRIEINGCGIKLLISGSNTCNDNNKLHLNLTLYLAHILRGDKRQMDTWNFIKRVD